MSNGGRMFGGFWINMPKDCRKYLTMDGEPLVDIDFKTFHPTLLYEKVGAELPDNPYVFKKGDPRRDIAKILLNAMINNQSDRKRSIRQRRNDITRVGGLEQKFIEKTGRKPAYKELIKIIKKLETLHKPIECYFYTGIGIKLQNEESKIMKKIMKQALKQGIVILPCHDGAMCKNSDRKTIEQLFNNTGYEYEVTKLNDEIKEVKENQVVNVTELNRDIEIIDEVVIVYEDISSYRNIKRLTIKTTVKTDLTLLNNSKYFKGDKVSVKDNQKLLNKNQTTRKQEQEIEHLLHKGEICNNMIMGKNLKPSPINHFRLSNIPQKRKISHPDDSEDESITAVQFEDWIPDFTEESDQSECSNEAFEPNNVALC